MIKAYVQEVDYGNGIRIAFIEEGTNGKRYIYIYKDGVGAWDPMNDLSCGAEPQETIRISRDSLNALIKELAKRGYKSGDENRIIGELQATKLHLADMRKIVFHTKERGK